MNILLDNKWDSGLSDFSIANLENVDCILHGRKRGEGFIPYWTEVANNPNDGEHKLGKRFSEIPNAVFSNTLGESKWGNTSITSGDITAAISVLKNKTGKDIAVKGMHTDLGYPLYFIPFIGIAKYLGVAAILIPGFPRLKEWAYAGLFFDPIGATYSIIASGGNAGQWGFMIMPIALGALSYFYYHKRKTGAVAINLKPAFS